MELRHAFPARVGHGVPVVAHTGIHQQFLRGVGRAAALEPPARERRLDDGALPQEDTGRR